MKVVAFLATTELSPFLFTLPTKAYGFLCLLRVRFMLAKLNKSLFHLG